MGGGGDKGTDIVLGLTPVFGGEVGQDRKGHELSMATLLTSSAWGGGRKEKKTFEREGKKS